MNYKPIIIVPGEPNSIFLEIFFKTLKSKKIKSPLILICSKKLLILQMKKLRFNLKINILNEHSIKKINNNKINLINVEYNPSKAFRKIDNKSKKYINECFKKALDLLNRKFTNKFINGPISKKHFLEKKFFGITEFIANKTNTKKFAMLIYNKELSVVPITTHLPIKLVSSKIKKKNIIEKVKLVDLFYRKFFKIKPKIAVTGINPHCESIDDFNEDIKIIEPSIKFLKKNGIDVKGPFSADTIFLKDNRKRFNVIIGMYHDQVLTPIKTLFEYDAINITLGLPFLRVSPDHGPNEKMIGKRLSNPTSLIKAISFLDY